MNRGRIVSFAVPVLAGPQVGVWPAPLRLPQLRPMGRRARAALTVLAALSVVLPLAVPVQDSLTRATSAPAASSAPAGAAEANAKEAFGQLPAVFEVNAGQASPDVRYLARAGGATLFLGDTAARLAGPEGSLTMRFVASDAHPALSASKPLPGMANYFVGNDPAKWHANVATSEGVTYHDVYPGIDLTWYGAGQNLEYDYVVAPGADPAQIVLSFDGAKSLALDGNGDLLITTADGAVVRHKAPALYQTTPAGNTTIPGSYQVNGTTVGFTVGSYDTTRTLTIDPVLYSTLLSGTASAAQINGVDIDTAGNAYVTGVAFISPGTGNPRSSVTDFPTTSGAYLTTAPGIGGGDAGFVAKFNPNASGAASLAYSTYIGGGETDAQSVTDGLRIAVQRTAGVDPAGTAYIMGTTASAGFPTTPGAYQPTKSDPTGATLDMFITKLNPAGSALVYSTYFGGSGSESGSATNVGFAFNGAGVVALTGQTTSTDLPVLNAVQSTSAGGQDAFAMKLDTTVAGSAALLWSTYLGTTAADVGRGIALDSAGNAYIVGTTGGDAFPGTASSPIQPTRGGSNDGFVTELSAAGAQLWATYMGGSSIDSLAAVALDSAGNVVVVGQARAPYTGTPGAYQVNNASGATTPTNRYDALIAKIASGGGSTLWRTLYGGTGSNDTGLAVSVNASDNVYLIGQTNSTDLPMVAGAEQPTFGGFNDAFLAEFNSGGTQLLRSTFLGGPNNEIPATFVRDTTASRSYIVGLTQDPTGFPTTANAYQQTGTSGVQAGFLTVLSDPSEPPPDVPEVPWPVALPGSAVLIMLAITRRRQRRLVPATAKTD